MIIIVQFGLELGVCRVGPTANDGPRVTIQNLVCFLFRRRGPNQE
jgi:hypothetical protein